MKLIKKNSFNFRFKKKKKIKTDTTIEVPENFKTYDPDRKKYACAYCGDKFPQKLVRAQHEKAEHVNSEGTIYRLGPCRNVSTTPLWQWGFRQCLPFS